LDSHQHHRRARWPIRSHGSLDWQRNDRLGWNWRSLFEQRREILRAIRPNTNTDDDSKADPDPASTPNTEVSPDSSAAPLTFRSRERKYISRVLLKSFALARAK